MEQAQEKVNNFAFENVREEIYSKILNLLEDSKGEGPTCLSQAFLQAICYVNNDQQGKTQRVLILQLTKDDPVQSTKIVNGIFACQKLGITIDCLVLE